MYRQLSGNSDLLKKRVDIVKLICYINYATRSLVVNDAFVVSQNSILVLTAQSVTWLLAIIAGSDTRLLVAKKAWFGSDPLFCVPGRTM